MRKLEVVYEIVAKTEKLEASINKIKNDFNKVSENVSNVKSSFEKLGSVIAKVGVAFAGVIAAFQSIKSGVESLINVKRLEVALRNSGVEASKLSQALEELKKQAEELSNVTGVDDDDIIKMQQLGIQAGLTTEQTKKMVEIALDVSKAFGLDLNTAMIQTIRTFQAGESTLTRYDARLKSLIQSGASNAEIAKYLASTYGGMAKEVGKLDIVNKFLTQFKNLIEELIITIYPLFNVISEGITKILRFLQLGIRKTAEFFETYEYRSKKSRLEAIEKEIKDTLRLYKVYELLERKGWDLKSILQSVVTEGGRRAIISSINRIIDTEASKTQVEYLQKLINLLGEYRQAYEEFRAEEAKLKRKETKETGPVADVEDYTKVLGKVKRELEGEKKTEESIYERIKRKIEIVQSLLNLEKSRGEVNKENLEYLKEQVNEIGNLKILGKSLNELLNSNLESLANTKGLTEEQKKDLLNILTSFKELLKGVDNLSEKIEDVSEDSKDWRDDVDEVVNSFSKAVIEISRVADISSEITKNFIELAEYVTNLTIEITRVVEKQKEINKETKNTSKGISDWVLILSTQGVAAIVKIVEIASDIVKVFSYHSEDVSKLFSSYEKLSMMLDGIKRQYEVIVTFSERFIKFSKEYNDAERQRIENLKEQFNILSRMLNLTNDYNNVNINVVNAKLKELQTERERLETMRRTLENLKGVSSTFLGINVISKDAWNNFAGIVNELYRMGKITSEQKEKFLDNFNVAEDIKTVLEKVNNLISENSSMVDKVNEYVKISNELSKYGLEYQISFNEYQLQILEQEERINELKEISNERTIKKQIEILQKLKELYAKQNDTLKINEIEIKILEKQKQLQKEINKTLDERLDKIKELIGLGKIDIENYRDVAKIAKELKNMGVSGMDVVLSLQKLGVKGVFPEFAFSNKEVNVKGGNNIFYVNAYTQQELFYSMLSRFSELFKFGRRW